MLSVFSCTKKDIIVNQQQAQYPEPKIDSVSLPDFPETAWEIRTDTVPNLITNTVNLPFGILLNKLKLNIYASNTTLIETDEAANQLLKPDAASNLVVTKVNGGDNFMIRLINHNTEVVYVVRINANQFPDPDFSNLSFTLNPNGLTPLAGALSVSSSESISVKYTVKGQDGEDYTYQNKSLNKTNQLNLFGLYPNTNNTVKVVITNAEGSMASRELTIHTDPLPQTFPAGTDITVNKLDTTNAKTRFILFYPYKTIGGQPFNNPGNMAYPIVLDRHGRVRWYLNTPFVLDMKPMPNGHFLLNYYSYIFREVDLLGNIYKEITPPVPCHHDFQLLPNGNIIYTGADLSMNGTDEDKIYEINYQTGATVKMINLYDILDPTREQQPFIAGASKDWLHNNSLAYDATDNSIIITGRHQSNICKIDYATNKIKWMISSPDNWKAPWSNYLLQPTGADFEYTWGQHSVVINPTDHNKLMVFDNGNARSYSNPLTPANSYSRIAEFSVDPASQTVSQSFAFGKQLGSENYSPALGSVDYVMQNYFVCFPLIIKNDAGIAADNGTPSIRFMEMDKNSNVLLDIRVKDNSGVWGNGYRTYRGHPFCFVQ
jgi:arylsulfate sulfotransferase